MTIDEIKEALVKTNGSFDPNDINDQAALVMLSAAEVGPDRIRRLATFTGLPVKVVSNFVHRLRNNGVFKGKEIHANWMDPEDGGVAFNCDVLVATGMLNRAP